MGTLSIEWKLEKLVFLLVITPEQKKLLMFKIKLSLLIMCINVKLFA
jgi:hypothetical protein